MCNSITILVLTCFLLSPEVYSQKEADSITNGYKNSINLTLGGKTHTYNIEYVRNLLHSNAIDFNVGVAVSVPGVAHDILFPLTIYLSYGNKWKIEGGVGCTILLGLSPSLMTREEFFMEFPDGAAPYRSRAGINYNVQLGVKHELERWVFGGHGLLINSHPIYTKERESRWYPWAGASVGYKF